MTCPLAWTPASVRPAPSTRCSTPSPRRASAASRTPWTVRFPGLTWKPAKSVPSYSTVAPKRLGAVSRRACLDEFDLHDLCGIAATLAETDDPGEAGGPVGVPRGDLIEELRHHERFIRELGDDGAACGEVPTLRERDDLLDAPADLLGLRLGRLHALVADDRHGQVLEQAEPRPLLAAELAPADPVRHRSALGLVVVERLVRLDLVVEPVALGLRDDEAAHAKPLLHLVERLLAEVAHPQEVVVLELEQLADLHDVVSLQRVVGAHREVELFDRHVEHVRGERCRTRDRGDWRCRHADGHERAELVDE